MLGTGFAAYVLSYVYLWFLPMVPLAVTAWLVWSRNLSYGYWFVTSQCLAWTLGTISYYALPTLGPGFQYVQLYTDLAEHAVRAADGLPRLHARLRRDRRREQRRPVGRRLRQPALRRSPCWSR